MVEVLIQGRMSLRETSIGAFRRALILDSEFEAQASLDILGKATSVSIRVLRKVWEGTLYISTLKVVQKSLQSYHNQEMLQS